MKIYLYTSLLLTIVVCLLQDVLGAQSATASPHVQSATNSQNNQRNVTQHYDDDDLVHEPVWPEEYEGRDFTHFSDKDWVQGRQELKLDVNEDAIKNIENERVKQTMEKNLTNFYIPIPVTKAQSIGALNPLASDNSSQDNQDDDGDGIEVIDSRLHSAVDKADIAQCKYLLSHGADINGHNGEGKTALHIACLNGTNNPENAALCEFLITSGASVTILTQGKGWAPVHCAAIHDDPALMEVLIAHGAKIDARTLQYGDTPLHIACKSGNTKLCEYLLHSNASTMVRNIDYKTPFDCAFDHPDISVARIFSASLGPIIQGTIRANRPGILTQLLRESKNLKKDLHFEDGTSALHVAATATSKDHNLAQGLAVGTTKVKQYQSESDAGVLQSQMIKDLISSGKLAVDAEDALKRTPLHVAIEWGQPAACVTLIEHKASLTKSFCRLNERNTKFTPLTLGVLYDNDTVMNILLEGYIKTFGLKEFEKIYPFLLKFSVEQNSLSVVKLLLKVRKKYSLDELPENLFLLHKACLLGNLDLCIVLLNEGFDPSLAMTLHKKLTDTLLASISDGKVTPLHCAAFKGHAPLCEALLERRGVFIDSLSTKGKTPLDMAVMNRKSPAVDVLIKQGADIAVQTLENASLDDLKRMLEEARRRYSDIPEPRRGVRELQRSPQGLLSQQDAEGKTLLMRVVESGEEQKTALLLEYPINLFTVDSHGRTVLHSACFDETSLCKLRIHKFIKTLSLVLAHKDCTPDFINSYDNAGKAALHYAAASGSGARVAIQELLQKGANPDLREKEKGETTTPRQQAFINNILPLQKIYNEKLSTK